MGIPKLEYLKITGDISVEPVTTRIPNHPWPVLYLIMGPTGAGKSSFIEALAGKSQKLSISKDQLAGYTQTVTAYKVVNVLNKQHDPPRPVYLIDTPGFSDSKIAEIEIMEMVRKWVLRKNNLLYSGTIFYLIPITETRLPGSRRRTFAMLRKLFDNLQSYDLPKPLIVTTMWDTVHNEQTRNRAESNFAQLRDETLKKFVNNPRTDVIKFMNTRDSALLAMDRSFSVSSVFKYYDTPTSPLLYQDLHDRIQCILQEKKVIELDMAQLDARTNADLRAILERSQRENNATLTKFIDQLVNFGKLPPGCRDAAYHLRRSILANARPTNMKQKVVFWKWAQEPELDDQDESNDYAEASQPLVLKDLGHFAVNALKCRVAKVFKQGK